MVGTKSFIVKVNQIDTENKLLIRHHPPLVRHGMVTHRDVTLTEGTRVEVIVELGLPKVVRCTVLVKLGDKLRSGATRLGVQFNRR